MRVTFDRGVATIMFNSLETDAQQPINLNYRSPPPSPPLPLFNIGHPIL